MKSEAEKGVFTDAHVHMGYYPRFGRADLVYYSPRKVLRVLNLCGVRDFIVSSTCAQIKEIGIDAIVREAQEMKRLAGRRAHLFFWLSGHLFDKDPAISWMHDDLFEGVKLHERETPWFGCRRKDLRKILDRVAERRLPVQLHTGDDDGCRPEELARLAREYPPVRFDFAHCRLPGQSAAVLAECPNVYVDTAYYESDFNELRRYDWRGRLLYGSDLPVWQAHRDISLARWYRKNLMGFHEVFSRGEKAFQEFLKESARSGDETRKCAETA